MELNLRMKELRGSRTQQQVADELGINRQTYRYYESGERNADYETLFKIADFYGVSIDYLLGRETKKQPTTISQTEKISDKPISKISLIAEPYAIYPSRQLIAFVDILNTKEMCKKNSLLFANLLKETFDNFKTQLDLSGVKTTIKIKCFSDNIAVVCEYAEKTAIEEISNMIKLLSTYQIDLLRHNVTCRGCLTIGQVYIDDTFVIGNGLIDAYLTENKTAIFPRIIISDEIVDIVSQHLIRGKGTDVYRKDYDGHYFVNYLSIATKDDFEIIEKLFRAEMSNKPSETVAEKYLWLRNYSNNISNNENISYPDFCEKHKESTARLVAKPSKTPPSKLVEEYGHLFADSEFVKIAKVYNNAEIDIVKGILVGYFLATAKANGIDTHTLVGY